MGLCRFPRAETRCGELCSPWVWSKQVINLYNHRALFIITNWGFVSQWCYKFVCRDTTLRPVIHYKSLTLFLLLRCSFESMSKLCERYNRAIDGILQLVSEMPCRVYKYLDPRCKFRPRPKFRRGLLENTRNVVILSVDLFLYNQGVNFTCQSDFITVKVAVIVWWRSWNTGRKEK